MQEHKLHDGQSQSGSSKLGSVRYTHENIKRQGWLTGSMCVLCADAAGRRRRSQMSRPSGSGMAFYIAGLPPSPAPMSPPHFTWRSDTKQEEGTLFFVNRMWEENCVLFVTWLILDDGTNDSFCFFRIWNARIRVDVPLFLGCVFCVDIKSLWRAPKWLSLPGDHTRRQVRNDVGRGSFRSRLSI